MSGGYGGLGLPLPIEHFQIGFDEHRNMWTSFIMQDNNFAISEVAGFPFFLEWLSQCHQLFWR